MANMIEQIQNLFWQEQSALLAFVVTIIAFYVLKTILLARIKKFAEKTKTDIDDLVVSIIQSIGWLSAVALSLIIASFFTDYFSLADAPWLNVLVILVVTYQIGKIVGVVFHWTQREMAEGGTQIISGFKTILVVIVWIVGLVAVISSLGYDVTSLVAGLGIGGLAVALALQNILGDVFSSVSIFFDKPFTVGDHILVGTQEGVVEQVGLKTTRIRSQRGELIVMANKDLTNAVVQNFGALERRRVVMSLGFEYGTPNQKIDQFRVDVEKMIDDRDDLTFNRCFFKNFGDSALLVELVFYIDSNEYSDYVDGQHELNLWLKQYCEEQQISMAFPTQTVHVKN